MQWPSFPLTDLLTFQEGPGILAADFHAEGIPLIRLAGLKRNASLLEGCNYLEPEKVAKKWNHFKLMKGDVLLSTSASLGEVAVVDEQAAGAVPYTGIIRFKPIDERIESSFLPYYFRSRHFFEQVQGMGAGSVMKHFGPMHLRQMRILVPPPAHQASIAEVLGALDDKIAANSRLVRVAHELLQAMHSQTLTSVDADVSYVEIAAVGGGGTPSTNNEQYWGGSIRWAAPSDITALEAPYLDDTPRHITESGLAACSSPLYPAGSIFMTSRATIGAFAIPQAPTAVNQGFIVVQPHDGTMKWWLFHEMQRRVPEYVNRANGATFLELPRGVLKSMTIALPSRETIQSFRERAEVLHARSLAAVRESRTLAQLRDTLLPALMDGRLRVRDAIEQVEGNL